MSEKKRIVIVGGVAGGASAAARARRLSEEAEITLFERGEYISFANCGLPYHIGGSIKERKRLLVQTPEMMAKRFRVDVRTQTEVTSIDRERKEISARDLKTGQETRIPYDNLVLSPGAAPIRPPLPGIDSKRVLTLRNMADMDAIIRLLDEEKPETATVIGGGYIGLEMVEALVHRGVHVSLVELLPQVMGPADPEMVAPIHQEIVRNGVELHLDTSAEEFREVNGRLEIHLSSGEKLSSRFVILAIGVKPEVDLARDAGLAIGERGGIVVDEHMQTSDPAVFAVGDAVEVTDFVGGFQTLIPLAGPANRQGRIAADNIFGRGSTYKKTQGTAICKVFDLAIGMTGSSEKLLKREGRGYEKVYIHSQSHAEYYPGASPISLKLLFDPKDGKILGAQSVGKDGVDKRIDVLAVAIRAGLTAYDLEELELSYAPPYGSAKDPVNYAGFVAANFLRGDYHLCHIEDVANLREDQVLLDVRTPKEVANGTIPGAVSIPLDELRDRLGEVPREKELLVFCQIGLRGYLACRILCQHGYKCRDLTGGYKTYLDITAKPPWKSQGNGQPTGPCGKEADAPEVVKEVDACGLQCPGPIMAVSREIEKIEIGQAIAVKTTDPGFAYDIPAWCQSTGNRLVEVGSDKGCYRAVIARGQAEAITSPPSSNSKKVSLIVFSNDFDRLMASFVIANGAAAMGKEVTVFFTFWGLNALRKKNPPSVKKNLVESMFGWMMPRGAEKLTLSKMNMGGMGLSMIKGIMRKKNVPSLSELIASAQKAGVRLVACSMSMDLMGIKKEELIDGVEEGGVALYLGQAERAGVNLFI